MLYFVLLFISWIHPKSHVDVSTYSHAVKDVKNCQPLSPRRFRLKTTSQIKKKAKREKSIYDQRGSRTTNGLLTCILQQQRQICRRKNVCVSLLLFAPSHVSLKCFLKGCGGFLFCCTSTIHHFKLHMFAKKHQPMISFMKICVHKM